MRIYLRDIDAVRVKNGKRYCRIGARRFFREHGWNWQDFLDHGRDAQDFLDTGDAMAARVVKTKECN